MTNWKDVGDTVQSFVTAGGIVVGGIFTYYKFVKDRIYRPRVALKIQGQVVAVDEAQFVKSSVSIENIGSTRLSIDHVGTAFYVAGNLPTDDSFEPSAWDPDTEAILDVFAKHNWLEAHESIAEDVLVRVPTDAKRIYRLRLRLVVVDPAPTKAKNIEIWTTQVLTQAETQS